VEFYKSGHYIHKFFQDRYNELIISDSLRGFALSLIALFIPLFLLTHGYTLVELLVFEFIVLVFSYLSHVWVDEILPSIGLKHGLILSYVLIVTFYAMLFNFESLMFLHKYVYLLLIGILNALSFSFYWMSHHHYFIDTTESKTRGKKLGLLVSIPVLLSVVSPLIGGYIISTAGYSVAFFVTILLLVAGSLFLFPKDEIHDKFSRDWGRIFRGFSLHRNMMYLLEGVVFISGGFFWPVFLYFIGIEPLHIGGLYFASNVAYAISSYIGGKLSDTSMKRFITSLGAIGHGFSLIGRAWARTGFQLTILQVMGGLFAPLWILSVHSTFFKFSDEDPSNSILNRELYMHAGRLLAIAIIFFLFIFMPIEKALLAAIMIAGFLTFLFFVLIDD
jgi:hypothetical protein